MIVISLKKKWSNKRIEIKYVERSSESLIILKKERVVAQLENTGRKNMMKGRKLKSRNNLIFKVRENSNLSNTLFHTTFIVEEIRSSSVKRVVLGVARQLAKFTDRIIVIEGRNNKVCNHNTEEMSIDRFYADNPLIKKRG